MNSHPFNTPLSLLSRFCEKPICALKLCGWHTKESNSAYMMLYTMFMIMPNKQQVNYWCVLMSEYINVWMFAGCTFALSALHSLNPFFWSSVFASSSTCDISIEVPNENRMQANREDDRAHFGWILKCEWWCIGMLVVCVFGVLCACLCRIPNWSGRYVCETVYFLCFCQKITLRIRFLRRIVYHRWKVKTTVKGWKGLR